jgi:iron-sulfur cluster assembly protein
MLNLTETAAEQVRQAATQSAADDMALRVAARMNDEGEIEFGLGFDAVDEADIVIDAHGVKVLVAPSSQPLLTDITLDFSEVAPGEMSFVFLRANSGGGGGCGTGGGGGGGGCGSCGSGCGS